MITVFKKEMLDRVCCCGHTRYDHRHPQQLQTGSCVHCGGIACPTFHEVGEGHSYAFEAFVAFVVALLLWGAWACWRVRQRVTGIGTKYSAPLTWAAASPIIFPTNAATSAMNPNPLLPPIEHRFKPGNPGGSSPRGKRISTWMAEFGEMPPEKWPSPKKKSLPANARIAIVRLRKALDADKLGLANAEYVEPRVRREEDEAGMSVPMLQAIAAAIFALKAAGVDVRRAPLAADAVEAVMQLPAPAAEPTPTEDEDDDGPQRAKRFRRGRA